MEETYNNQFYRYNKRWTRVILNRKDFKCPQVRYSKASWEVWEYNETDLAQPSTKDDIKLLGDVLVSAISDQSRAFTSAIRDQSRAFTSVVHQQSVVLADLTHKIDNLTHSVDNLPSQVAILVREELRHQEIRQAGNIRTNLSGSMIQRNQPTMPIPPPNPFGGSTGYYQARENFNLGLAGMASGMSTDYPSYHAQAAYEPPCLSYPSQTVNEPPYFRTQRLPEMPRHPAFGLHDSSAEGNNNGNGGGSNHGSDSFRSMPRIPAGRTEDASLKKEYEANRDRNMRSNCFTDKNH